MKKIIETLIKKHRATHVMIVDKLDGKDCGALFNPGLSSETLGAERYLHSQGFQSQFTIAAGRPCVTWFEEAKELVSK